MSDDRARHGLGGNRPPEPILPSPEEVLAGLIARPKPAEPEEGTIYVADLIARVNDIDAAGTMRLEGAIEDQERAEAVAQFATDCKLAEQDARALLAREVAPYEALAAVVRGFFSRLIDRSNAGRKKANALIVAWDDKKESARLEAERKAREAERRPAVPGTAPPAAAPPPAPPPPPEPVRSDHGAIASIRRRQVIEVVDAAKVPRRLCSPDMAKIRAELKAYPDRAIPGVKVSQVKGVANL